MGHSHFGCVAGGHLVRLGHLARLGCAEVMQIAMLTGFITNYPANWWLLKRGIKERI